MQRDKYISIFHRDNYICQNCGKWVTLQSGQLAHKIAKSKSNYKKYGKEIIDHEKNLVLTCSLECNGKCNIGNSPERCKKLVKEINNE